MIMETGLPDDVRKAVEESYQGMCDANSREVAVAVRSSATAEDLPTASFAGQQSSFLNIVGKDGVANAVLECLASVFTDRAITYRVHNKFDHMAVKVGRFTTAVHDFYMMLSGSLFILSCLFALVCCRVRLQFK